MIGFFIDKATEFCSNVWNSRPIVASEQKEQGSESRVPSDERAAVGSPKDKFEEIVDSLLRFVWRFAVSSLSFALIPRSALSAVSV